MGRPFSLRLYLLIVICMSWPFQIAYFFLGENFRPILLVAMIMVAVATFISGKYIFRDGFANAGWQWGKPRAYLYIFGLSLFLWLLPSMAERLMGWYTPPVNANFNTIVPTFLLSFLVTLIPAFSEELGWRGYLLPRLLKKYRYRRALLIHGLITWLWHLPFLVIMGLKAGDDAVVSVPILLTVSFVPTIMHAIVFAYIWSRTASLAVSTVYHVCFDEVRDTLEGTIGLGIPGAKLADAGFDALRDFASLEGKMEIAK